MVEYVDRCYFTAGSSGTSDFSDGTAESTYRNLSGASAVNGSLYTYFAVNGTEWELGRGAYLSAGGGTLARTTIIASSTGSKVSFSSAPKVMITLLKTGLDEFAKFGKRSNWIDTDAMIPRITNGPSRGVIEMATNKNMYSYLAFDPTTQEFAQFKWQIPSSFNGDTITFKPKWMHPATTTNFGVVWQLQAVGLSDSDAGDVAFGTAQTSTDTGGTTSDVWHGPESSAITISNYAAGDLVLFQVARVPANASDNMAVDAWLLGIEIFYTESTSVDA